MGAIKFILATLAALVVVNFALVQKVSAQDTNEATEHVVALKWYSVPPVDGGFAVREMTMVLPEPVFSTENLCTSYIEAGKLVVHWSNRMGGMVMGISCVLRSGVSQ